MSACTQPENFQGKGGFMGLGHFNKHFVKNTRKKDPTGKHFGVFSPANSQSYILNGKFNSKDTIRTQNQGTFSRLWHMKNKSTWQSHNLSQNSEAIDASPLGVVMSLPFDHVTLINLYISNYGGHRSYVYPLQHLGCHQLLVLSILS